MLAKKIEAQILGGQLKSTKQHMYGFYRGFAVSLQQLNNQYLLTVRASSESDPKNVRLGEYLLTQKESIKQLREAAADENYLGLVINPPTLASKLPDVINGIVEPIFQHLATYGYTTGCEFCGSAENSPHFYNINGDCIYLCGSCYNTATNALLENKRQAQSHKSSLLPGIVGAFLGSLIGCALWVALYRLGYIAGLAGAVAAICAIKGYEFLGKGLDKKGVFISVIIAFAMIFVAHNIAFAWDIYDALRDLYTDITFADALHSIGDILTDAEIKRGYVGDLAMGYIFTALCTVGTVVSAFRSAGGHYEIKRMQ